MSISIEPASFMNETNSLEDNNAHIPIWLKLALWVNLFYSQYLFRVPFDFYAGYFFIFFLLPFYLIRFGVAKHIFRIFGMLLLSGLYHIVIGNNFALPFFKVFIGAFASYYFFYIVVIELKYNLISIFKVYLYGALVLTSISVIQFIAFVTGLDGGTGPFFFFGAFPPYTGTGGFGIRISTFFGEPTYFAMFLSGAVFVAIHDLLFMKNRFYFKPFHAIIVVVGVYFSFSGTILGTIGLSFLLIGLNYGLFRYFIILVPVAALILFQVIGSSVDFSTRYEGTLNIFLDNPEEKLDVFEYHGSSVILYNNFHVALENFKKNPLFGTGIGSHPIAFEKYSLTKNVKVFGFALNTKDANSMFNRLMSETGLFGLGLFILFLIGRFVKKSDQSNNLWIISSACLVVIVVNMGRQGHYFLAGFPFYVWMYYAAWKESKIELTKSLSPNKT